jgi:hypothetical protein
MSSTKGNHWQAPARWLRKRSISERRKRTYRPSRIAGSSLRWLYTQLRGTRRICATSPASRRTASCRIAPKTGCEIALLSITRTPKLQNRLENTHPRTQPPSMENDPCRFLQEPRLPHQSLTLCIRIPHCVLGLCALHLCLPGLRFLRRRFRSIRHAAHPTTSPLGFPRRT